MDIRRRIGMAVGVFVALLMSSCDIINPAEQIPGFVLIDEVNLQPDPNQGADTHRATHIIAAIDGVSFGGFPLPAKIPVLGDGEQRILLQAGVEQNGMSGSAVAYPFYERKELTLDLAEEEEFDFAMDIGYDEDAIFGYLEDFEFGNSLTIDLDGNPLSSVQPSTVESASGNRSGQITLSQEAPSLAVASAVIVPNVPSDGSAVFIELDYRNEVEFAVGLVGISGNDEFPIEFLGLRVSEDWNKVYINLTNLILESGLNEFRVLITADYSGVNEEQNIFLDNLKFIHF